MASAWPKIFFFEKSKMAEISGETTVFIAAVLNYNSIIVTCYGKKLAIHDQKLLTCQSLIFFVQPFGKSMEEGGGGGGGESK